MGQKLLEDVKRTAKKRGYLAVGITGSECWNYPSEKNDWGKKENVRADGASNDGYDVEGHKWTDINMQVDLNLWKKEDLLHWFRDFRSWLEDVVGIWRDCVNLNKKWFNLDLFFSFIWKTLPTLGLTKTYWVATVQSFEVAKGDLAEEKASSILESSRPPFDPEWLEKINDKSHNPEYRSYLSKLNSLQKHMYQKLTYKDVSAYVLSICEPVGGGLYVLKEDPTVIYVDESVITYDMKDGFSNSSIISILLKWTRKYLNMHVFVIDIKEKGQKSKLWREIKAAALSVDSDKREGKYDT